MRGGRQGFCRPFKEFGFYRIYSVFEGLKQGITSVSCLQDNALEELRIETSKLIETVIAVQREDWTIVVPDGNGKKQMGLELYKGDEGKE